MICVSSWQSIYLSMYLSFFLSLTIYLSYTSSMYSSSFMHLCVHLIYLSMNYLCFINYPCIYLIKRHVSIYLSSSSSIHHHQFIHTDREGLHRTIKADIANSTNVSPAYTGNNIHYHIDQNRAISSYHNYHHHDNIIISSTKYEFVYNQTKSISPNYAPFS